MKNQNIFSTLLLITLFGCNSIKKVNTENNKKISLEDIIVTDTNRIIEESIVGTEWILSEFDGRLIDTNEQVRKIPNFLLSKESDKLNGYTGCNSINGNYSLEKGDRIRFYNLGGTKMACFKSIVNEAEYLKTFELIDNYKVLGNKLILTSGKRAPLAIFTRKPSIQEPIVEKYWKLEMLKGKIFRMNEMQERETYFILKNDTKSVNGFAGCNSIFGNYELGKNNGIKFNQMRATFKLCIEKIKSNETELMKVFELADNYSIVNDVLYLSAGKSSPLAIFEAVYL